ncbi:hypothetical protein [Cupriavidus oxalaticus]|uniref:hypothetical protein n=1 Tax=Cupriavidus oxalaticus TaxID=96344 RepID=UPI0014382BD6|nr:hypothetical protein [Cupriavidus oxalaticus]
MSASIRLPHFQPPHGEQTFGEGVSAAHECGVVWSPQINASASRCADIRCRYFSSLLEMMMRINDDEIRIDNRFGRANASQSSSG